MNNEVGNQTNYNAVNAWSTAFNNEDFFYPSEYVIRIFKGSYPRLHLSQENFKNKKILDMGCGDARHMLFLSRLGFDSYGVDISNEIVQSANNRLRNHGISENVKIGYNVSIPFDNSMFDYTLSWNSCYYMGSNRDFDKHLSELSRVTKDSGKLILSIPKKSCFIYKDSKKLQNGYAEITNDPFNLRNGEVLKYFNDENDIKNTFSKYFKNFTFGSIEDDCFGFNYHWHLCICEKA